MPWRSVFLSKAYAFGFGQGHIAGDERLEVASVGHADVRLSIGHEVFCNLLVALPRIRCASPAALRS